MLRYSEQCAPVNESFLPLVLPAFLLVKRKRKSEKLKGLCDVRTSLRRASFWLPFCGDYGIIRLSATDP